MKKAYYGRELVYQGQTDSSYENGKTYTVDITPFSGADNRVMVYKTVTNLFEEGSQDSGYRVYPSIEEAAKDFKKSF